MMPETGSFVDGIALGRVLERERCAQIIQRKADSFVVDGKALRGAPGAMRVLLLQLLDLVRAT